MSTGRNVIAIANDTAQICGVSDNYVRKCFRGERTNEVIILVAQELGERYDKARDDVKQIAEKFKQTGSYDF